MTPKRRMTKGCDNPDLSLKFKKKTLHFHVNDTVSFTDIAGRRLSINGRDSAHQQHQSTPSAAMLATKGHLERFITMSEQHDAV